MFARIGFFKVCAFVFILFSLSLTALPNWDRQSFPYYARPSLFYLMRAVQLDQCYLQDCPALKDIKDQIEILGNNFAVLKDSTISYLTLYTQFYSILIYIIKKITQLSWLAADIAIISAAGLIVAIGIAWWLRELFGSTAAGLALLFLTGVNFLPEPGIFFSNPNALAMGFSMLFWAILIRKRGQVDGWLLPMVAIQVLTHSAGFGYAGITIAVFMWYHGWPVRARPMVYIGLSIFFIVSMHLIALLVQMPVMWAYDKYPLIESSADVPVLDYVLTLLNYFAIGWQPMLIVLIVAIWQLMRTKQTIALVFVGLCTLLCAVALLATNSWSASGIFSRYWILLALLLVGMTASFVVTCLTSLGGLLQRNANPCGPFVASGLYYGLLVLLPLANLYVTKHMYFTRESPMAWSRDLAQRENFYFDTNQVKMLFDSKNKCNKILYMNYPNEDIDISQIMIYAYFVTGAMSCGAVLNDVVSYPENQAGRAYMQQHRHELSHIVFLNPLHKINPQPLSIRDGQVEFQLEKGVQNGPWRWLLRNPDTQKAEVVLASLPGTDAPTVETARFTLPPGWEGWVSWQLPPGLAGSRFRMELAAGRDVLLQGMRLGEESSALSWPWDQGIGMSFQTYHLEHGKRLHQKRITTRFTVAELAPEWNLTGRVVEDRGFTVLATVGKEDAPSQRSR
ncbi:MAG: hypothetical protein HQM03_20085 [Magnetococcales bacterium]|nr:hypothetical protein [Magnetococcales bacterium]